SVSTSGTPTLSISAGSAGGGSVNLSGDNAITGMTTESSASNGSGGNIELLSFAGSTAGSGRILTPSLVTLTTGGSVSGTNGDVTVIAGAPSGVSIYLGGINTTGGASGGTVSLNAATPTIVGSSVDIQNGTISSG